MERKGGKSKSEFTIASIFILVVFVALIVLQSNSLESIAYGVKNNNLAFSYRPVNNLLQKITGDFVYSDSFSSVERREIMKGIQNEKNKLEIRLDLLTKQKNLLIKNIKEDTFYLASIAKSNDLNLFYEELEFEKKIIDADQQLENLINEKESKAEECKTYTGDEKQNCFKDLIDIRNDESLFKENLRVLKSERKSVSKKIESNKAERYLLNVSIDKNKNRLKDIEDEISSADLHLFEYSRVEKQILGK